MKIGKTKSVCPVCFRVIDAVRVVDEEGEGVFLEKTCEEHGFFRTLIWEDSYLSYLRWNTENTAVEHPVLPKKMENECPNNCGLCEEHKRKGCCMLVEVTKRCNLNCPVCFASAGGEEKEDLTLEEIRTQFQFLMEHGGPFNIQLSGGEPTVREDLPQIIRMGRSMGFTFFQLNTNGIRLAKEPEYAKVLKEAGLNTVFLQFDGVDDSVYQILRGKPLLQLKLQAIEHCRNAGLGVCLVPVIAPKVNEDQVGAILQFAMERMPYVRGVHFQPISYFGRCGLERTETPITIPRILSLIEEQTGGKMKADDFAGGGAENPYCSFHGAYLCRENGIRLLKKKSGGCCCCTTSDDSRTFVEQQWALEYARDFEEPDLTATSALDEFLQETHLRTFTVSGMLFQDAYNLDLERLQRCYICEVDPEYGMVPFCAYNLTNTEGKYLYRK